MADFLASQINLVRLAGLKYLITQKSEGPATDKASMTDKASAAAAIVVAAIEVAAIAQGRYFALSFVKTIVAVAGAISVVVAVIEAKQIILMIKLPKLTDFGVSIGTLGLLAAITETYLIMIKLNTESV